MKSVKMGIGSPKVVCLSLWIEEQRAEEKNQTLWIEEQRAEGKNQTRTQQYTYNHLFPAIKNTLNLRLNI